MKKTFKFNMDKINENIMEVEKLLKESMNFCDEEINELDNEESDYENDYEESYGEESMIPETEKIDSYVNQIRKFALNGLSNLSDNPESEEYQMLKKIFQMCDKKPEKKENVNESHRLFGVLKENNNILFETIVENVKNFNNLKETLINETIKRGYKPSEIRLISENKIIK